MTGLNLKLLRRLMLTPVIANGTYTELFQTFFTEINSNMGKTNNK